MQSVVDDFAPLWSRAQDAPPLDQMLYVDTKVCLPDDLLIKADKMTMAASVELRVPFLDHELLEYAWTLPPSMKRRGRVGKRLLRVAMAAKLPQPILTRPKQGFPVPLHHWLRTSLFDPCREVLLAASSSVRAQIGESLIDQLLTEHRGGAADRTEELYALWVWETWHRVFLTDKLEQRLHRRAVIDTRWAAPATRLPG
jgi:asparagine synthase (glutamine-hydrolysing)